MAHMIESNEDMFSVREVPWHGLGIVLPDAPSSEDAIRYAGLDWNVDQVPAQFTTFPNGVPTYHTSEDYFFNIRSDNSKPLGVVTSRYRIVQNKEAFAFTDALIGTGEVVYETAGCLQGGKRIWLLARLPEKVILGDEIVPYLCFSHGHDGKTSVKSIITPTRVVCNNTYTLALRTAVRSWTTKHTGDMQSKLAEAKLTLQLVDSYMAELNSQAEDLVKINVVPFKAEYLAERLFPIPENATDRTVVTMQSKVNNFMHIFMNAPDLENFRHTGWGFISALSDYISHAPPQRETANYKESRLAYVLDNTNLTSHALELLRAA